MIQEKKLDTLYKKTGKTLRRWEIWVEFDEKTGIAEIVTQHGVHGGELQIARVKVKQGKNQGRANATTVLEQAHAEAESKWKKQRDKGYLKHGEQPRPIPRPMLALEYKQFPVVNSWVYVQPKLDGVRALAKHGDSGVELFSRQGKVFEHLDHIVSDLNSIRKKYKDLILDGELYVHGVGFQNIISWVKRKQENTLKIQYHVYDIYSDQIDSEYGIERQNMLRELFNSHDFRHLRLVVTETAKTESGVARLAKKYVNEGYEGAMVRVPDTAYTPDKRSKNLLKFKNFISEEFEIIDVKDGVGKEEKKAVFVCKTKDDKQFQCRPRGNDELRTEYFVNREKLVGQMLTVRFFEWTEDGVPRFPVGVAIRDYE